MYNLTVNLPRIVLTVTQNKNGHIVLKNWKLVSQIRKTMIIMTHLDIIHFIIDIFIC